MPKKKSTKKGKNTTKKKISNNNKPINNSYNKTTNSPYNKAGNSSYNKTSNSSYSKTTKKPTQKPNTTVKSLKCIDKKNIKGKFSMNHPKLMIGIKICIIMFLLLCVIGAGVVSGVFFGLFGDEFEITKEELTIAASNSVVVDIDGEVVAELSGDERRKIISLSEMADYLPEAYVAIEDERFYSHKGVDIKRTGGAIVNTIIRNKSKYGGSTITQQLVKNITKDDESNGIAGYFRKVKEWAKAYQVEQMISKDQILELYLNILFVGGNNHGVELGARHYFNKSASELDLVECAFLAGINHSPNAYNPYKDDGSINEEKTEKIKTRTKTVLNKMQELEYINKEEYNDAIEELNDGIEFEKGTATGNIYSYHTDATISQVIADIAEEKQISTQLAENYVYSSGLTIYSTQNTKIQERMEQEFAKDSKYIRKSSTKKDSNGKAVTTQAAMVVIDNKTGYVVGTVGGLGEKEQARGLNRATQSTRQTGSVMKPLATMIPGLQEGIITAGTVYDDVLTQFGSNYKPKDYNTPRGLVTLRDAMETSQNIPFVKVMMELTPKKSLQYLKKMGITSLDDKEDTGPALAIGGLYKGVSPLEMAAAYATIANNGEYISPTFYTKVTDASQNTILTAAQTKSKAFSEQVAYVTKSVLTQPVVGSRGTATFCKIPGIDVAAKTGTTNGDKDRWLCGFTNYYSAATWYGFDDPEQVVYKGTNPAGQLWDNVMTDIHKGLANSKFKTPSNIVTATICKNTGMLASDKCINKYSEVFINGTVPKVCEGHTRYKICKQTGKLANQYCPAEQVEDRATGAVPPKEKLKLWKPIATSSYIASASSVSNEVCDIHKEVEKIEILEDKKNETNETNETVDKKPDKKPSKKENTTENVNKVSTDTNTTSSENKITTNNKNNTEDKTDKVDKTNAV